MKKNPIKKQNSNLTQNIKEDQNNEFKQSWKDEYLKWISGFANAQGGNILIGIDDNGNAIGINNIKHLLEYIPNKVRDILGIIIDIEVLINNNNEYLSIQIEPYPYPVSYKGQYYYRSGSSKLELKGASLDKFLLSKQGKKWDGVPVPFIKNSDLDKSAFDTFRQKAIKKKRVEADFLDDNNLILTEKLHLIEGNYLRRASILLFYSNPEKYITGSHIKIGYFKSDSELIYQDKINGNIIEQVDKTIDLIFTKYFKAYISYEGIQRIESFPISQLAFREALINAIVHKDYGELTPIQISIYDDKLLIWNAGELPPNWTVETLKQKHASIPFNPVIANVFFIAGLIESWGRGIDKITKESEAFNKITPNFSIDNGIWVEFKFNKNKKTSGKTSGKTSKKILELILKNPLISIPEMATKIEITERSIERNIQKLQKNNILIRIGGAKGGYWSIK